MGAERRRLLVADDDKEMRVLLAKVLSWEGFDVDTASNGEEALQLLRARPDAYKLLISDIRMPERDGISLITEVRASFPNIRIVMITGYGEISQYLELFRQGVSRTLRKPFKIPDLLDAIEEAIPEAKAG